MTPINRNITDLHPAFAAQIQGFLDAWNAAHPDQQLGMFEGLRVFPRQAELYAQGRTAPGSIVTNAPAGMSWHCYGLAADLVFDADPVKPGMQWTWDGKMPWPEMGAAAQAAGLEWAGAWLHFKEFPHVQNPHGMQLAEALELFNRGGLQAVWAAIG